MQFTIETNKREEIIDITKEVEKIVKEESTNELTREKYRIKRELKKISDAFFGNMNHKLTVKKAWKNAESAAESALQRWGVKGRGGRRTRRKQRKGKHTRRH